MVATIEGALIDDDILGSPLFLAVDFAVLINIFREIIVGQVEKPT